MFHHLWEAMIRFLNKCLRLVTPSKGHVIQYMEVLVTRLRKRINSTILLEYCVSYLDLQFNGVLCYEQVSMNSYRKVPK